MSAWWDEDHKICLLTVDEFNSLPEGTQLECINGKIVTKGVDYIDLETRYGHIAYGVTGSHPLRTKLLFITEGNK